MYPISKDEIYQILVNRYPAIHFAFLYGSSRHGMVQPGSDIDCLVINIDTIAPSREHFRAAGSVFDVYTFDPESLHAAMRRSYEAGAPMLVESVLSSETLPVANTTSERLMEIARILRKTGYRPTTAQIINLRTTLTSLLDDLKAEISGLERSMRMAELVATISKHRLLALGEGSQSARYTARILQAHSPVATAYLDATFQNAINGDATSLLQLGQQALEAIGGPLRDGYKVMMRDYPRLPL